MPTKGKPWDCDTCDGTPAMHYQHTKAHPIVLSPAQVVALGERTNQARLNNGCVCAYGCDSCGRLAEAFTRMEEALQGARAVLESIGFEDKRAIRQAIRAALRLAEEVRG